jgi:glycerophosphoryl diester phosphodiesterase
MTANAALLGGLLAAGAAAQTPCGFLSNGVTAHRGNSIELPQNTLPAFASAVALGADWVETDIHLTKDGQVIICHDADTAATCGKRLVIAESTCAELRALDAAAGFRKVKKLTAEQCPPEKLPLLEEAIAFIMRQNRTRLSIQPKDGMGVAAAFEIIRRMKAEKWVGFNDGSLPKMRLVKTLDRSVPVFWDLGEKADIASAIATAKKEGFESLVVNEKGLTKEKVDAIRAAGLEAGVWTVNDETALRRFVDMGAQRIYTDAPGVLLKIRKEVAE